MHVVESLRDWCEGGCRRVGIACHLGGLAADAGACPLSDILVHPFPYKMADHYLLGGANSRVRMVVQLSEELVSMLHRDVWPKSITEYVSVDSDLDSCKHDPLHNRVCQELLHLGVTSLVCSNGGVVDRRGRDSRDVVGEGGNWGVVDSFDISYVSGEL